MKRSLKLEWPGEYCRVALPEMGMEIMQDALVDAEMHGAGMLSYLEPEPVGTELFIAMLRKLSAPYRVDRTRLGYFVPTGPFERLLAALREEQTIPAEGKVPQIQVFHIRIFPVADLVYEGYPVALLTRMENWPELIDAEGLVIAKKVC